MALEDRQELAMESIKIAFTNAQPTEENFTGIVASGLYLKTTANCYIAFDTSANDDDFLLEAADRVVEISPTQFTKLSVLGASGSGTLYVIAVK